MLLFWIYLLKKKCCVSWYMEYCIFSDKKTKQKKMQEK